MNYSITWKRDDSADYKFYHTTNSVIIPDHKDDNDPWKYPFVDIFIYQRHPRHNILTYRNGWRDIKFLGKYPGEVGFVPLIKWPNGTKLVDFGDYKMRVSTDNEKYLENRISPDWYSVGVSPWYNHYTNRPLNIVEFDIDADLYNPTPISALLANASNNYQNFNFGRYSLLYQIPL